MPGFIKPQFATLRAKAPAGDGWIYEIKFDGYRAQVHVDRGRVRAFTRGGLDFSRLRAAGARAQLADMRAMHRHSSRISTKHEIATRNRNWKRLEQTILPRH